jgi:tetratricopeptide (TPR) repeat protein
VVVTDSSGFFRIPDLPAGSYLLRIEKDGYRVFQRADVPLMRGSTLRVNAELLPATIQAEEVAVSARAPVVDVGTSSVSTGVTSEYKQRVPVAPPTSKGAATRSFESVAEVVPGAKADSYGVSIAGASSPENSYLVDGLSLGAPTTTQGGVVGGVVGGVSGGVVGGPRAVPPLAADPLAKARSISAYSGRFASVMDAIKERDAKRALEEAAAWHAEEPGDEMALVALGEALEASGDAATAARAYGSLIDLFPSRADIRRFAGERLERVKGGDTLALDTFEKAAAQRPDHPSSHRLLAFARLKRRDFAGAFDALAVGLRQPYPGGRFEGAPRILREDLGLVAAAWIKADPRRGDEIRRRLWQAGVRLEQEPSVRFVLNWETDANDVDLHVSDARGNHAFYGARQLPTGGELYADVTTGYGPECFAIIGGRRAGPYALQVHYYARGPMGFGMGKVEILEHDGKGGLRFDERPFVVMTDQAVVDLGKY